MIQTTKLDLFVGIPVGDYAALLEWYERLLGFPPAFFPTDTEAVWELAAHRYIYIAQDTEHAGHTRLTLFVDDLDALVAQIAERGIEPAQREIYANHPRASGTPFPGRGRSSRCASAGCAGPSSRSTTSRSGSAS